MAAIGMAIAVGPLRAEDEAVERVLIAHDASVARIGPVHFSYEYIEDKLGVRTSCRGEYWRIGPSIKITCIKPGGSETTSIVTPDSVVVTTEKKRPGTKGGGPTVMSTILPNAGPLGLNVNPWEAGLLALGSAKSGPGFLSVSDAVREQLKNPTCRTSGDLTEIATATANVSRTLTFDRRANYLLCRTYYVNSQVTRSKGPPDPLCIETSVKSFQEPAKGVFFPEEVTREERFGNEIVHKETTIFKNVSVGAIMPQGVFKQNYREGTRVTDRIKGTVYTVGPGGGKGEESPFVPLNPVKPSAGREVGPRAPTKDEGRPFGWWLAPLGLVMILAGAAIAARRRFGRSAD